ncbi:histidine phosphatase family protein [Actinoplanes sp. NBRC 103695]|uniref:histidine phosphatase family protein n=1 Tax=Actinoplanes sp. NBRC 103695 TaxID=3032202 RepID=UPI0024A234D0|nr:histidine phosphatase family protein [Actinoplanes sp. NBRC 103695]GLY94985.1 phosphoglycerate mutase [Actinoplanes sp. NBRC 103695]
MTGDAASTEVVLVRHALPVLRSADGPDELTRPLTAEGMRQAAELVATLTEPRPAAIWSSPHRRAIQTVQPAADALGLPVRTRWELREWDDGLPFTEDWEPHYAASWANLSFARPGGESLDQLSARAVDAVLTIVDRHRGQLVLVAGHGHLISRILAGFGLAVDYTFARRMPMPAIYRLRFTGRSAVPGMSGPGVSGPGVSGPA